MNRFPFARFRFAAAGLVALLSASGSGCNSGITDSRALRTCVPRATFTCTCAGGGTGFQYCKDDGTLEDECRCDGSMPDYPDAGLFDGGTLPVGPDAGFVDAATP